MRHALSRRRRADPPAALVAAVLVSLAAVPAASGQTAGAASGLVRGVVSDSAGTPLPGVVVRVYRTTLLARTDNQGRYRLPGVPAGEVRLQARAVGYAPATIVVTLADGDSATADFTLVPTPFELPSLEVVGSRVPGFGGQPVTTAVQITRRELDRRAVNTVDEAIDRAAGVQLLNGQINIRGSTGYVQGLNSRVLLLVDGVPMNQGDRGGINWDLVPVDQIERVDILKGAGSSLYGSAALGGVVNLTTRDVAEGWHARVRLTGGVFADPPHPEWRFREATGLHGGGDVAVSYGTPLLGARLAAGARHSDGYRQQDERDHWQFAGKARWQAAPATRVDVSGAWAVDQYDVPLSWCNRGECADAGQAFQPFKVDTAELGAYTDSRKGYLTAQLRTTTSERFAWQARASWLRTNFRDLRRTTSEFGIANRFGVEARLEAHPAPTRSVVVGAEATRSDVTSDIFGVHTQTEFASYGESEQDLASGRLRVHAGVRVDFIAVDDGSLSAELSPRIGITLPQFGLRASLGRGFRAPTVAERFVSTVALGFEVIPNPNLRSETAWSAELGYTWPLRPRVVRIDAALFWTEARDLIEPTLLTSDTAPQIQLQNVAEARIAGLDATVFAAPLPGAGLTGSLAYTYLYARGRRAGAASFDTPLAFRPTHLLTLSADYQRAPFSVGADFRYASRPERIELEGFVDPRRVATKVLDLRAAWRRHPFEVRVLVVNALDYIYNLVPETLAPVRTASVTVMWAY
ncbi:MAG: TonB-dependent receptor [Gemmatimonadales bacterium]